MTVMLMLIKIFWLLSLQIAQNRKVSHLNDSSFFPSAFPVYTVTTHLSLPAPLLLSHTHLPLLKLWWRVYGDQFWKPRWNGFIYVRPWTGFHGSRGHEEIKRNVASIVVRFYLHSWILLYFHRNWTSAVKFIWEWESRTNQTEQEKTVICSFLISKCLEYQHRACPGPLSSQCSSCGKGSSAHMFAGVHCCVFPLISSSEQSVWWSYSEESFHLISSVFFLIFDIFNEPTQDFTIKIQIFSKSRAPDIHGVGQYCALFKFMLFFPAFLRPSNLFTQGDIQVKSSGLKNTLWKPESTLSVLI